MAEPTSSDAFAETPPVAEKPLSRFRLRPRPFTENEFLLRDAIIAKAQELEALYGHLQPNRYHSLALTALEKSVMWAIENITR